MEKCADERKFLLNFIERYHCLEALWNVKLEAYSNRDEKRNSMRYCSKCIRSSTPRRQWKTLKKINALRTNFRREKQRLAECSKSGAGAEESLDTNLFYFKEMGFINDVELPCTSKSTINIVKDTPIDATKRKSNPADELLEIVAKRFSGRGKKVSSPITDSWTVKLDRMTPQQRVLCEKFVEDIIFEGQMGTLHRNSVQINSGIITPTTFRSSSNASSYLLSGTTSSSTPVQNISNATNISLSDSDLSQSQISNFFSSFSDVN